MHVAVSHYVLCVLNCKAATLVLVQVHHAAMYSVTNAFSGTGLLALLLRLLYAQHAVSSLESLHGGRTM